MEPGEKRDIASGTSLSFLQQEGLVEMRQGARMASQDIGSGNKAVRLPLLYKSYSFGGVQRSENRGTAGGGPMASGQECAAGAGHGASRKHEKGLVAVYRRSRMESGHLFPDRSTEVRLPGLRGENTENI